MAAPRGNGEVFAELMAQVRPNGRIIDHFRIGLGSSALLTQVVAFKTVSAYPALAPYRMQLQHWGRDIKLRRNMASSGWTDVYHRISTNDIIIKKLDVEDVVPGEVIRDLLAAIKDQPKNLGSYRHAIAVGPDQRMRLELQFLPATSASLMGKPTFSG